MATSFTGSRAIRFLPLGQVVRCRPQRWTYHTGEHDVTHNFSVRCGQPFENIVLLPRAITSSFCRKILQIKLNNKSQYEKTIEFRVFMFFFCDLGWPRTVQFVTVFASVFSTALAMKKFKTAIYKSRGDLDISITPPRTKNVSPSYYVLFNTVLVL